MVITPFWCKSYIILVLWVGDGLRRVGFGNMGKAKGCNHRRCISLVCGMVLLAALKLSPLMKVFIAINV